MRVIYPVSVFTPTWNQRPELLDRSVRSALVAGAAHVAVIDDGSERIVENIWDDSRVEVTRIAHGGVPAAFAAFLQVIREPFVLRLPSDDELHEDALACAFERVRAKGSAALFWDHREMPAGVEHVFDGKPSDLPDLLRFDNRFYGGCTLIEAKLVQLAGPHPADLLHAHDWHFHLRIAEIVPWDYLPLVLTTRWVYPHGLSSTACSRRLNEERVRVVREYMNRRLQR